MGRGRVAYCVTLCPIPYMTILANNYQDEEKYIYDYDSHNYPGSSRSLPDSSAMCEHYSTGGWNPHGLLWPRTHLQLPHDQVELPLPMAQYLSPNNHQLGRHHILPCHHGYYDHR